jgi:hypothetical protein
MKETHLGTIYAAGISQTKYISAEKTCLDRLAVPGLCTMVWHSYSVPQHEELSTNFLSSEEDHFLNPTKTLQNAHNLTWTTYSNPVTHFLTSHCIFWPVITIINQPLFKRNMSSLGVKIKVVLVVNFATSTFKVINRYDSNAFSNKRDGLDRVT